MNTYEAKKQARIERMRERAEKKREFASNNDLSLYGEAKSGIPLGQPILVGHHSERRHRRALERIENRVRKGYEAADEADRLEERAAAAESRTAIDTDNPEAANLIAEKIKKLETDRERYKTINKLIRKCKTVETLVPELVKAFPDLKDPDKLATNLLTPDFAGRIGVPSFRLTNLGAEIRRLKQRQDSLKVVQSGFETFVVPNAAGDILVELVDGQVQVEFPFKPCEETRSVLKRSPLALKWSSYSKRWVRKHTESTAGQYFQQELRRALEGAKS